MLKFVSTVVSVCFLVMASYPTGATPSQPAHPADHTSHHTQTTKTKVAGKYLLTLSLKPTQHFYAGLEATQPKAEGGMKVKGGNKPMKKNSLPRPNHFLGLIVKEKRTNKTVKDADVEMGYARVGPGIQKQMKGLPVVKMYIIGKGVETTRYGNNARLSPGRYRVHVTINDKAGADFTIRVRS